jgi:hypothetical protein
MKLFTINGNASGHVHKIWTDDLGKEVEFFCIFATQLEAEKMLEVVGNGMWHIEEREIDIA